ncbi:ABC-type sugar transport system, permease component [Sphaerochaeta pleomorpha str. Grapes]|uniref:ABC-type sugar transport system, permease component n=1 Tax=Sphaerochaeta pleomorpha (strain ATCC BAA-1885 / DSM 22778 / Grapes) TaxID=158190 RepID=G8QY62_SPHPG|nr:carbohydrate ABC transporter permease [Sphaerochaeta pleomorpha]AEV29627.1 ABC-type sugar transport system, permease component [Sphaerochaeta pleomorpha str. Grapes]
MKRHPLKQKTGITILSLLFIAIWFFPLIWMVITSMKLENEVITKTFSFFPANPTFANYTKAFTSTYILNWMVNSAIVSLGAMVLTLIIDAPIAYAFAKIQFKGKNLLFWIVMGGMMVPFQVLIVPLYLQFNSYGMINTLASVVLPRIALPIGIFILKQFYEGIPVDLEEAAFIDGSSRLRIFLRIILPLGQSAMATVIILSFINTWNDFLWPLIAINDTIKYTITVGIANFQGTHGTQYSLIMAGATIASIPQILFYIFFRKKIIAGIATSGMKG